MLVLSRKVGEKVVIGGEIEVCVTKISGGRVVLGFKAPQDTQVRRGELLNRQQGGDDGRAP